MADRQLSEARPEVATLPLGLGTLAVQTTAPIPWGRFCRYGHHPDSVLLGHSSLKITEKHYAPWVKARQEQLEAAVRKAW